MLEREREFASFIASIVDRYVSARGSQTQVVKRQACSSSLFLMLPLIQGYVDLPIVYTMLVPIQNQTV